MPTSVCPFEFSNGVKEDVGERQDCNGFKYQLGHCKEVLDTPCREWVKREERGNRHWALSKQWCRVSRGGCVACVSFCIAGLAAEQHHRTCARQFPGKNARRMLCMSPRLVWVTFLLNSFSLVPLLVGICAEMDETSCEFMQI